MSSSKIILSPSQEKAVKHKYGPLLVVAGAGTGKTRVITERIRHLINHGKTPPQSILAVTFTEKASQEMLERLDDTMPLGYEEPWIYTFHSFADRILRNDGLEIGLDTSYKIIATPEQWLLLRQNLFKLGLNYFRPLGNPTKFISAILKFISRLQDENISQEEFQNFADTFSGDTVEKSRWQELALVYKNYEDLKSAQSKMDFGDLIYWTLKLFTERPNILAKYQRLFQHVLVDEFQDTNHAQYELIKMLCPKDELNARSLLVVGDDSQSIYKFRGAAISNILEFQSDYPSADMVTLVENYRSNQKILDSSYKLIQNNNPDTLEVRLGISKELKAMGENNVSVAPIHVHADSLEEEVEGVIAIIKDLFGREPGYTYKDFAILARANSHLEPFIFALRKHGLPYQLVGNRGLYDREEVRDITALLKVIINPEDAISMYRVLNIVSFDIPQAIISTILAETRFKKISMWEFIKQSEDEKLISFRNNIEEYQGYISDKTPTEFVYALVTSINYLHQFLQEDSIENKLCVNNLNLFLERIKKFEVSFKSDTNEIPTIVDFLDFLELMIDAGDNPAQAELEDIETINLLTVHASKGLEFPVVFMVNLVSDRFPTRDRKDLIEIPEELIKEVLPVGNAHIQEERRLFYVGMTRARKYLYLTSGQNYGGKRDKKISGYVEETGIKQHSVSEILQKSQEGLFGINSAFRDPKLQKIDEYIPYSLSYSKIDDYKTCPLKYKYRHVLNIPSPPSFALSFGTTIHETLRDYHSKLLFGENVSLDGLLDIYKSKWQPLGFLNAEHRAEYFKNGERLLEKYWHNQQNSKVKPLELEKSFNVKIGGIKFFGRIDRIDPLPDGGVEIIDYKTGGAKTQKEVDADTQVAVYALAVKEAFGMDAKKLTYHYLEDDVKISTERTSEDLDQTKEDILETVTEIRKGSFVATPGMHCDWCEFKHICPFVYKN